MIPWCDWQLIEAQHGGNHGSSYLMWCLDKVLMGSKCACGHQTYV